MIRRLPKPTVTSTDVFTACVSSQISPAIAARLLPLIAAITTAENDYARRSHALEFHAVSNLFDRGNAGVDDLIKVYTDRMAKQNKPGRVFYDLLMNADGRTECPYCGIAAIASLDHYLPKARYLGQVVNPKNLVPSCDYCQDEKKEHAPSCNLEQVLHPYFDSFNFERWLFARVVEIGGGPVVLFFAENRNGMNIELFERLECHMKVFGLRNRFTSYVATRLSESAGKFARHGRQSDASVLRAYIDDELIDVNDAFLWMRPYLESLRDSDWFCAEGFLKI